MLSKKDYKALNRVGFQGKTKQEIDQKYQQYIARYKKSTLPVIPARKTTNGNRPKTKAMIVRQPKPPQSKFRLSECLMLYAKASIDPFENIQKMPCIPDTLCAPSFKFRTFVDTTMTIGTFNVGFAAFNPWTMFANDNGFDVAASDYPVITTNATYPSAGYSWTIDSLQDDLVGGYNSNSPYTIADLEKGAIRLVAAGLELEYTGQLLNQSGAISVIQWDGLKAVPNPSVINAIRVNQRTQTCANSRESRCYVRYEPVSSSDFDYADPEMFRPSGNPDLSGEGRYYPLLIVVTGATPGTTFRVRAVSFFELQLSTAPVTPSDADPIGFPAFQAARTTVLPTQNPSTDLVSVLKKTIYNIGHSVSGYAPVIGGALGSLVGMPAAGAAIGNVSKTIFESLYGPN